MSEDREKLRELGEPELTVKERAWIRQRKLESERWDWLKHLLEKTGFWAKWFIAISAAIYAFKNGLADWLAGRE